MSFRDQNPNNRNTFIFSNSKPNKGLFLRLFKKIDFLGQEFNFEKDNSIHYKTVQGAFLSLLTLISILVIAFLFGQEVYKRENPNIASSREFILQSRVYLKDYPVLFSFHNPDTTDLSNVTNVFDFAIGTYTVSSSYDSETNSSKLTTSVDYSLKLTLCKDKLNEFNKYRNEVNYFINNSKMTLYCFNFNDETYFQNEMGSDDSVFIRLIIKGCDDTQRSDCNSSRLNSLLMNQIQMGITMIDHYVDSTDYSNPVKQYTNRIVLYISKGLFKITNIFVTKNTFISDNGWLLEKKEVNDYYYINGYLKEASLSNNDNLLGIILESPRLRYKDFRSYLKIQELFARVGGIANAMFILMTILSYHYLRFKYLMFIRKNTFDMMDKDYLKNINYTNYSHVKSIKDNNKSIDNIYNTNKNLLIL